MAKKYEYKLVKTSRDDQDNVEQMMNDFGKDGWEIIQFEPHTGAGFNVWLKKEV